MAEESREDLHHPGEEPARRLGLRLPVGDVRVVPGEHGVGRDDAELLLLGEHLVAVGVPAVVEHAGVLVRPLLGDVVGRMRGAEAEVQVERLVGIDLLGVGDELDGLVDQVLGEVVALLGRGRRLDLVVVVDQLGIPLARVAAEEAVEALEASRQWPAVVRPRRGLLVAGGQVPLADHERVVAVPHQHLGEQAVLEREDSVVTGISRGELRDAGHPVAVVVAAGEDAGAAGRAQRRGVHVVVAQARCGQGIEVRRLDRAAVATEMPEAGVVEDDHQHVRRTRHRTGRLRPGGRRLVRRPTDLAGEGRARFVLVQCHGDPFHEVLRTTTAVTPGRRIIRSG